MKELTHAEREEQFGHIEYEDLENGWVEITNKFESENLVYFKVPFVLKPVRLHKLIVPALKMAMHVISTVASWDVDYEYIKEFQTFAPRHKRNSVTSELSDHTYGIAFDINPSENMPNCKNPTMVPGIVKILKNVGFLWGGDWKTYKDYMHFTTSNEFFNFKNKW